jgi:hypothetical protein
MWAVTGWVIATWLRVTAILAATVTLCWLLLGTHSGVFWLACCAAVTAELYLSRQLLREWNWEAGLRWWWTR